MACSSRTESWLDAIPAPRGLWVGQRWRIGQHMKTQVLGAQPGAIAKEGNTYFVICRDGKIELHRSFGSEIY